MRAGTRGAQCVYVPYVLSASLEFLRAVARECGVPVSLLRDMVQCVGSRLLSCHCGVVFLWPGRYAGCCARDTTPPSPKGAAASEPPHLPLCSDLLGAHAEKESQTFSLIPFRILWIASAVGCQSTHARLRSPRLLQGNQPPCLQKPLEPETTAGQPAPVSTKAPGTRDYCRATGPRVCKSSLTWIQDSLPETAKGNQPPRLQKQLKSWTTWDNQSHCNPDLPVY